MLSFVTVPSPGSLFSWNLRKKLNLIDGTLTRGANSQRGETTGFQIKLHYSGQAVVDVTFCGRNSLYRVSCVDVTFCKQQTLRINVCVMSVISALDKQHHSTMLHSIPSLNIVFHMHWYSGIVWYGILFIHITRMSTRLV